MTELPSNNDDRDVLELLLALSRLGHCTRIRLEQAAGELVLQVGQDDRSVTLAYELKGSVRGTRKVAELIEQVVGVLGEAGLAPEIVSGGGTGTHQLDLAEGPFTEIQPGSYLFMDRQYGDVQIDEQGASPLAASLAIQAQVVSANQPDRATVNAGLKAMATEAGLPAFLAGVPEGATYKFMGDEHGGVMYATAPAQPLQLGDVVRMSAPHCDPTVNLHDYLHVVDKDTLVDIWSIDARGY